MINLHYVSVNMMSGYVMAGLRVAQELGGVVVTVQKPGYYSSEKAVLSRGERNLSILETEWISVEEHEQRLRKAIENIKNG